MTKIYGKRNLEEILKSERTLGQNIVLSDRFATKFRKVEGSHEKERPDDSSIEIRDLHSFGSESFVGNLQLEFPFWCRTIQELHHC